MCREGRRKSGKKAERKDLCMEKILLHRSFFVFERCLISLKCLWMNAEIAAAVFLGGDVFGFFKTSDKKSRAAVTHILTDFLNLQSGGYQQIFSSLDPSAGQIGDGGLMKEMGEISGNAKFIDTKALF